MLLLVSLFLFKQYQGFGIDCISWDREKQYDMLRENEGYMLDNE